MEEIHKNKNEWEHFKQEFKIKGTPTFAPYELEKWIISNLSDK